MQRDAGSLRRCRSRQLPSNPPTHFFYPSVYESAVPESAALGTLCTVRSELFDILILTLGARQRQHVLHLSSGVSSDISVNL